MVFFVGIVLLIEKRSARPCESSRISGRVTVSRRWKRLPVCHKVRVSINSKPRWYCKPLRITESFLQIDFKHTARGSWITILVTVKTHGRGYAMRRFSPWFSFHLRGQNFHKRSFHYFSKVNTRVETSFILTTGIEIVRQGAWKLVIYPQCWPVARRRNLKSVPMGRRQHRRGWCTCQ